MRAARGGFHHGLLVFVVALTGCANETISAETAGSETSSDGSTGESETDESETDESETDESETDESETGVAEDLCGNGVIDPGEDCEPVDVVCDTCTWDCQAEPLPANEWVVELELIDPRAATWAEQWEILATGPASILAVRGTTSEGDAWLYTFDLTGEQLAAVGPDEHGFDAILDHAVGVPGDLALLGSVGELRYVRHMLGDGSLEPAIEVDPAAEQVAITSHGFVHLIPSGPAFAIDSTGAPLWMRAGPYEFLGNVDDRVVLHGLDGQVDFIAGDDSDVLSWDANMHPEPGFARLASTPALMLSGQTNHGWGEVEAITFDLWTGEETRTLLVTGRAGREVDPGATAFDASSDGWPLLAWGRCVSGASAMGCGNWESGVGGPGNLDAVELHSCDLAPSTRIGTDGGVFVVTEQLDGSAALARRASL